MALFLSNFVNKVDKKGRVSVPAPFRAAIAGQNWNGVVGFPHLVNPCIEGCDLSYMEQLVEGIDSFAPFTEENDAFKSRLLTAAHQMAFDSEGRIMLPQDLLEHAGITDTALFAGRGGTFQIWNPNAYDDFDSKAKQVAFDQRNTLRLPSGGLPGGRSPGAGGRR